MGLDVRKVAEDTSEVELLLVTSEFQKWAQMQGFAHVINQKCHGVGAALTAFVAFVRQNSEVVRQYANWWWTDMDETERKAKSQTRQWMAPDELYLPSSQRYQTDRVLIRSLYGEVRVARDILAVGQPQSLVAVKASDKTASQQQKSHSHAKTNLLLHENVQREAIILRLLQSPRPAPSVDATTCGLRFPPSSSSSDMEAIVSQGSLFVVDYVDEFEDETTHYLVTEYVPGGDLFQLLIAQPNNNVNEPTARSMFRQLCLSVRYLHALSIAHLDLSLENVCVDQSNPKFKLTPKLKLIDFGLAVQHPAYAGDRRGCIVTKNTHARLFGVKKTEEEEKMARANPRSRICKCTACQPPHPDDQALAASGRMRFLCAPVCGAVWGKPGKIGYMSPEAYMGRAWDAFASDMYALGVILYSLLVGRPPYDKPDINKDVWFQAIYTGRWLNRNIRAQPSAAVYAHLTPSAASLIDMLIAPQINRPSIDQVLQHPWMLMADVPATATAAVAPSQPQPQ